jgi:hypothetical protein
LNRFACSLAGTLKGLLAVIKPARLLPVSRKRLAGAESGVKGTAAATLYSVAR